jgi:hypothetical protein
MVETMQKNLPLNFEERLQTFTKAEKIDFLKLHKNTLAENGFYFINDICQCISCRIKIKHWDPNDLIAVKHYDCSPNCDFLNNLLELKFDLKPTKNVETLTWDSRKVFINSSEEADCQLYQLTVCGICCSKERQILLTPCNHLIACSRCASQLTSCPVCRYRPYVTSQDTFENLFDNSVTNYNCFRMKTIFRKPSEAFDLWSNIKSLK